MNVKLFFILDSFGDRNIKTTKENLIRRDETKMRRLIVSHILLLVMVPSLVRSCSCSDARDKIKHEILLRLENAEVLAEIVVDYVFGIILDTHTYKCR